MQLTILLKQQADKTYRASVAEMDIAVVGLTAGAAVLNLCDALGRVVEQAVVNHVDVETLLSGCGIDIEELGGGKIDPGNVELV